MNIFKKIIVLSYFSFLLIGLFFPVNHSLAVVCVPPQVPSANGSSCVMPNSGGLIGLVQKAQGVLNTVVPVLITLGVVYFIWGVVQYVIADAEEAKKKGREQIVFGVIGLAVIVGIWGLVYIVVDTFIIDERAPSNATLQNLLPK